MEDFWEYSSGYKECQIAFWQVDSEVLLCPRGLLNGAKRVNSAVCHSCEDGS